MAYNTNMAPKTIREIRLGLELSQSEFAKVLGVNRITVSRWERGARRPHPLMIKTIEVLAAEELKKRGGKKAVKGKGRSPRK